MRTLFATLAAVLIGGQSAVAAEIKLLTTAAFAPVVSALAPDYEKQSGNKVAVVSDNPGRLMAKIVRENETFDVVVLTTVVIQDLARQSKVAGGPTPLAQDGFGVGVKEGAPRPDISTPDALKQSLLNARKIAYIDPASGGYSGAFVDQLLYRLHSTDTIVPKAVLVRGSPVAEHVVNGEADLGIDQISEIMAVKGAVLVGPIPGRLQDYTVYAGGISANTKRADDAKKLLATFTSENARQVLKEKGMEPPQG